MSAFLKNIKAFLQIIKAFLEIIKAFCNIAHDVTLHLANQLEKLVFLKKWNLTGKKQVESTFSPKT